LAESIVDITRRAVNESEQKPEASTKKAPAKAAKAAKSAPTAKKATKASAGAKKAAKNPTR
jgi:hypothetical protein